MCRFQFCIQWHQLKIKFGINIFRKYIFIFQENMIFILLPLVSGVMHIKKVLYTVKKRR